MQRKGRKINGRSRDLTFAWLPKDHGAQWEEWRAILAGWMSTHHQSIGLKLASLNFFVMRYLPKVPNGHKPGGLFQAAKNGLLPDLGTLVGDVRPSEVVRIQNHIFHLINWLIVEHFSEPNDDGRMIPLVDNPFVRASKKV